MASSTFHHYFSNQPDPRAGDPGSLDTLYRVGGAGVNPAGLLTASLNATAEVMMFLAWDTSSVSAIGLICPFTYNLAGGVDRGAYALTRDIHQIGTHVVYPEIVGIANNVFHQVQNVDVPTFATIQGAWGAVAAGTSFLDIPGANTDTISVRGAAPVPYPLRARILAAIQNETCDARFLVTVILQDMMANHMINTYPGFADWIRAATTRGPADAAGNATRPRNHMEFRGLTNARDIAHFAQTNLITPWLRGLQTPVNVQANLQALAGNQQQIAQHQVDIANSLANQSAAKTLADTNPVLCHLLMKLTQAHDTGLLAQVWQILPNRRFWQDSLPDFGSLLPT